MAGFFGLFNYDKPGPGVDKNAPKKKSFVVFFEILGRKFWKLILVNLLYVLFSLPVVTGGLANVGMTYITRNFARQKHAFVWGDFIDTIRKNWKQALPVGIINTVVTLLLAFNIYWYYCGEGTLSLALMALSLALFIIFSFMKYYIYIMMVTFSLNIRQLYKNSMIFAAMAGIKANLIISLTCLLCYAIAFLLLMTNFPIGIVVVLFVYVLIFPAFRSLLIQYCVFPVIRKNMIEPYYKEHPEADRKLLRNLNLELEEEPAEGEAATETEKKEPEEEERIFTDMGRTEREEVETPARTLPRQYSEREMRRLENKRRSFRKNDEDDDGTI